jgi:hypothetical protein
VLEVGEDASLVGAGVVDLDGEGGTDEAVAAQVVPATADDEVLVDPLEAVDFEGHQHPARVPDRARKSTHDADWRRAR